MLLQYCYYHIINILLLFYLLILSIYVYKLFNMTAIFKDIISIVSNTFNSSIIFRCLSSQFNKELGSTVL